MPYKDKEKALSYFSKRYWNHYKEVREYKLNIGCVDCGYAEHHAGLEFDHVPGRGTKSANVMNLLGKGYKALWDEIAKCDVVCATCHRIRTFNRSKLAQRLNDNV